MWCNLVRALEEFGYIPRFHMNWQNKKRVLQPAKLYRRYSTMTVAALPPQLSTDLIKIMEQRILAIEQRNAYLEDFINQTARCLAS